MSMRDNIVHMTLIQYDTVTQSNVMLNIMHWKYASVYLIKKCTPPSFGALKITVRLCLRLNHQPKFLSWGSNSSTIIISYFYFNILMKCFFRRKIVFSIVCSFSFHRHKWYQITIKSSSIEYVNFFFFKYTVNCSKVLSHRFTSDWIHWFVQLHVFQLFAWIRLRSQFGSPFSSPNFFQQLFSFTCTCFVQCTRWCWKGKSLPLIWTTWWRRTIAATSATRKILSLGIQELIVAK